MALRRYQPLRPSHGTTFSPEVKQRIRERDGGCIGPRIGMPGECAGPLDPDHVRASGALNRKSRSTEDNGATLCRFVHHRMKTDHARTWRPVILAYLAQWYPEPDSAAMRA